MLEEIYEEILRANRQQAARARSHLRLTLVVKGCEHHVTMSALSSAEFRSARRRLRGWLRFYAVMIGGRGVLIIGRHGSGHLRMYWILPFLHRTLEEKRSANSASPLTSAMPWCQS